MAWGWGCNSWGGGEVGVGVRGDLALPHKGSINVLYGTPPDSYSDTTLFCEFE